LAPKEDEFGWGASGGILDPFLVDSVKVFIDGIVCFVYTSMNKFNMYLLNRFENISRGDNLSCRITSGI
jgi:hypothetical protein